jgi:hypothetical protein
VDQRLLEQSAAEEEPGIESGLKVVVASAALLDAYALRLNKFQYSLIVSKFRSRNEMTQRFVTDFFSSDTTAAGFFNTVERSPNGYYTVSTLEQTSRRVAKLGTRRPSHPCMNALGPFWDQAAESIEEAATLVTTNVLLKHSGSGEAVGRFWHTALSKRPMRDVYEGVTLLVYFHAVDFRVIVSFQPVSY